jgi:hypothetical protein
MERIDDHYFCKPRDRNPIGVAEFEAGHMRLARERISLLDSSTIKNASDENCSARR